MGEIERLVNLAGEGDLHAFFQLQNLQRRDPKNPRLQEGVEAYSRETAQKMLEVFTGRMHPRIEEAFRSFASGKPCTHAFSVGDTNKERIECHICGRDLAPYNPSIDRPGDPINLGHLHSG